jgi:hypothetical protein
MPRLRLLPALDDGPTLNDIKLPTIEVVCAPCARRDFLERKALVKQFGANASFLRLRRRLAMGCERLCYERGDSCGTRFPCLEGFEPTQQRNQYER